MDEIIERITAQAYAVSMILGTRADAELNAYYQGKFDAYNNVLKMMGVTDV